MHLHGRIIKIYNEKFLKPAQQNWHELESMMRKGNDFPNPDIGQQLNYDNKKKYFTKDYGWRVADKICKIFKGVIDGKQKLNILDVGCGFGVYALIFKEFGHNVLGTLGGNWYLDDYKYFLNLIDVKYNEVDILDLDAHFFGLEYDIVWCAEILTLPSVAIDIKAITHQLLCVVKPTGRIIVMNHSNKNISPTLEVYN